MSKYKRFKWSKRPIDLISLLPNIITIIGLCIGISSIRFALENKWEISVLFIVIAAILDGIDGKVARLLKSTSPFGAELDSLCDFVNFGISPMLLSYLSFLNNEKLRPIFWGVTLFYTICTAARLARFNTMAMNFAADKLLSKFFIGVPAPAGALLVLIPLMSEFELKSFCGLSFFSYPLFVASYQIFIAILMASKIPTFSFKNLSINPQNMWLFFIGFAFLCVGLILYTWVVIPVLTMVYLISIPISYWKANQVLSSNHITN